MHPGPGYNQVPQGYRTCNLIISSDLICYFIAQSLHYLCFRNTMEPQSSKITKNLLKQIGMTIDFKAQKNLNII